MASAPRTISFLVVIVSTSRYKDKSKEDISGELILSILKGDGHEVIDKIIIPDDPLRIEDIIDKYAGNVDVIIFSGGTGLSPTDITPDVIMRKVERKIPGFGELFRYLTYNEQGPIAMLSRACAGILKGTVIFSIPGSPNAVKLALEKLILPEIRHIVAHVKGMV
ncbi:MAG: molybdenum cofactor biosynthesis protein [Thermoprotei archaeon]|nr:MAG: molybdenum cofactor biosynthesis protein [Thermoprotei archaeon]RLF21039.1 MAG: molybdenum cofactor biosynthesis protein [Thermoprotei archaeon]